MHKKNKEENREEIHAYGRSTYFRANDNHVNAGLLLMPLLGRKKEKKKTFKTVLSHSWKHKSV